MPRSQMSSYLNLYDFEAAAQRSMSPATWDFIAGGAMDEVTLRRNRSAFEEIALRPRYLRDVRHRDLTTTLLGSDVALPIFVSPAGLHMLAHPEAELATVRGAGAVGSMMIVSSAIMLKDGSPTTLSEIAAAAKAPLWFQLYHQSRELSEQRIREAEEAGCRALCLTVDVPVVGPKERDLRHGAASPGNAAPPRSASPMVTWDDVGWMRGATKLPLVLKGINTAEDARLAAEAGVAGILVSTHGGRHFDTTRGAIESLTEVVEAANGAVEVYVDSGVRRGTDVLKALALGARGVGIGRPLYWGLAAGGAEGVTRVLELLRDELDLALAYCGQTSVRDLEPNVVHVPSAWRR